MLYVWALLFGEQMNTFKEIWHTPLKEIFDVLEHTKVFSLLNLWFDYH
jgi:hypothetical protein